MSSVMIFFLVYNELDVGLVDLGDVGARDVDFVLLLLIVNPGFYVQLLR